jgi:hypothetical protein
MRILLRLFSFLYHFLLSLFLFAIGVLTALSGIDNLKLGMLPWEGAALTRAVFLLGLCGLLITILAIFGRLKVLFPIYAALILVLMVRGFFLSPYMFAGPEQFRGALWLTFGALGAFLSSWTIFQKGRLRA